MRRIRTSEKGSREAEVQNEKVGDSIETDKEKEMETGEERKGNAFTSV